MPPAPRFGANVKKVEIMLTIARLQEYLRHSARQQYEALPVPSFTLFFHPADPLTFFNYAIPDEPCGEGLAASLSLVRTEFARHGRRPRFEFLEAFAPGLGPALQAAGFAEEARQPLMICTAETYRAAPEGSGLTITRLDGSSTVSRVREFLTMQRRGFDFQNQEAATEADSERFLRRIGDGKAFLAGLNGETVGAGMYTSPYDGLTEVAGLATLEPFRRKGIATQLAALAVEQALEQGAIVVFLTAADEHAVRVYERVGFVRFATMLAYIDSSPAIKGI